MVRCELLYDPLRRELTSADYGQDFTISGGSPNSAGLRKSVYAETLALQVPNSRRHWLICY